MSQIPEIDEKIKIFVRDFIFKKGKQLTLELLRKYDKETIIDENNPRRIQRALEVVLSTKRTLNFWHKNIKKPKFNFVP